MYVSCLATEVPRLKRMREFEEQVVQLVNWQSVAILSEKEALARLTPPEGVGMTHFVLRCATFAKSVAMFCSAHPKTVTPFFIYGYTCT
jgi:hypothetical protein